MGDYASYDGAHVCGAGDAAKSEDPTAIPAPFEPGFDLQLGYPVTRPDVKIRVLMLFVCELR